MAEAGEGGQVVRTPPSPQILAAQKTPAEAPARRIITCRPRFSDLPPSLEKQWQCTVSRVHKFCFYSITNGNFDTSVATKNRSRAGLRKSWDHP